MKNQPNLFSRCIQQQLINACHHAFGGFVKTSARRASLYAFIFCLSIGLPSASKSAPLPEGQNTTEAVCVNTTGATGRAWIASFFEQQPPNWLCNIVEFFSPVAPQGEPMPADQTQKESQGVNEYGIHTILFPIFSFFVGFWASGGFSWARENKHKV